MTQLIPTACLADKDVPDEKGLSKFPGNVNILVFDAQGYVAELAK